MAEGRYDLEDRLIIFAAQIVRYVDRMPRTLSGNYYGGQLLRSGGSPALHYSESQGAESDKDFIHKCGIALKELKESRTNLKIQKLANLVPEGDPALNTLLQESDELVRIMAKIIANKRKK